MFVKGLNPCKRSKHSVYYSTNEQENERIK